jgi:hypothetical protein
VIVADVSSKSMSTTIGALGHIPLPAGPVVWPDRRLEVKQIRRRVPCRHP